MILSKIMKGERVDHFETIRQARDGRRVNISVTISPIRDDAGRIVGASKVARDITPRTTAEQAARTAEGLLRLITDNLPALIGYIDRDLCYRLNNRAYEAWFGRPRSEITGRRVIDVVGEAAFEKLRPHMEAAIRGEDAYCEDEVSYKDAGVRWISASYIPDRDESGRVAGFAVLVNDITSAKQAERTVANLLRISERLNSTLDLESLLDLLVEESIRLVNAESGVAGLSTSEGMVCHKYSLKGIPVQLEYRWPQGNGLPGWVLAHRRPYLTNNAATDQQIVQELSSQFGVKSALCTPILDGQWNVLGFFELHNKKDAAGFTPEDQELLVAVSQVAAIAIQNALAYRSIRETQESLRQADRRKNEFLAMLAHELRNPLAPIRNSLSILRMDTNQEIDTNRILEVMERQLSHLVHLVDDLLDISRITLGKIVLRRRPIDLRDVLMSAVESSRPLMEAAGHQLEVRFPDEAVPLQADPVRLTQVVSNLLNNSARYTPRGGRVELIAWREGREATIQVADNGMGIAADMLPRVFDMFTQIEGADGRAQGGLGIGLTLVRSLVIKHGGRVEAKSQGPGLGSTFSVTLPIAGTESVPELQEPAPEDAARLAPRASRRILVVDDNLDSARSLGMLLEIMGHEVQIAHSGREALDALAIDRPEAVLLDIGMPEMDGYEVARRIRQDDVQKSLLLIALTGFGQKEDRERSIEAGFDAHLTKPVDMQVLEDLLAGTTAVPTV